MIKELSENPLVTFYSGYRKYHYCCGNNYNYVLSAKRSLEPKNNKIAICFIDGEFTVKRMKVIKDCLYLMSENPGYPPIKVIEENELIIWGIVTYIIKKL